MGFPCTAFAATVSQLVGKGRFPAFDPIGRVMTPSPRIRTATLAAAIVAVAALVISVGAPAAADPPVVLAHVSTADYTVDLTQDQDGWIDASVHNSSAAPISFGLEATLHEPNTLEPVWTSAWDQLAEFARADVAPGDTFTSQIPAWSGMGISVARDIDTTPVSTVDYRVPGPWFGFDVQATSATGISMQFGSPVTVTPSVGRAGESLHVSASGLAMSSAEVWIAPADAIDIKIESAWDFDVSDARSLGVVPVSGGVVSASVPFPSDLAPGNYSVVVGQPGGAFVPAGPAILFDQDSGEVSSTNVQIEVGEPRSTVHAGATVTPLDQNGAQPVSFAYPPGAGDGVATVTTSTTGPTPTGFTALTGASPAYYQLTSTSNLGGAQVLVCITFDTTGMTPAEAAGQHLYHFVAGAWADITDPPTTSAGRVCGKTGSFSPFAIGRPAAPAVWPFTGFLDPISSTKVNSELAGTIIPIRFQLGADRGLNILANGSPASDTSACTVGANAATKTKTTALVPSQPLQYVKATKTYWYLWNTSSSWAGTCRQFVLTLTDGSVHTATVKFAKVGLFDILRVLIKIF
jgi:hypothetical protein